MPVLGDTDAQIGIFTRRPGVGGVESMAGNEITPPYQ
jgi:hypothetical protein